MTKPILLLDVDGVLNPDRLPDDWEFEPRFQSDEESGGLPLDLSREMGAAIEEVGFDMRWLTTWGEYANTNIGPHFGWRAMPVAAEPYKEHPYFWKVLAVQRLLAEPGPLVVWIDDEADKFVNLFGEYEALDPHYRLIYVAPNPRWGLRREHLEWIKNQIAIRTTSAIDEK